MRGRKLQSSYIYYVVYTYLNSTKCDDKIKLFKRTTIHHNKFTVKKKPNKYKYSRKEKPYPIVFIYFLCARSYENFEFVYKKNIYSIYWLTDGGQRAFVKKKE